MQKRVFILAAIVCLLSIGIVSASFNFGSYKLTKTSYNSGEYLQGSFNISFSSQKDAEFTSNFAGGDNLLDLLDDSGYEAGIDYKCLPSNCLSGYSSSNAQTSKTFSLNGNKTFGFLISGGDIEATRIKFNVASGVPSSCINQLSVDLFDDKSVDFTNNKYIDETCGAKQKGCFEDLSTDERIITGTPYCEKIILEPAPAYRIGAGVINSTTGKANLKMEVYDADNGDGPFAECTLPEMTSAEEEIDCIVDYSSKKLLNALVCIYVDGELTNYKIKSETSEPCGVRGVENYGEYNADYNIYAQRLKYASFNTQINDSSFLELNPSSETDLTGSLNDYLLENYDSQCSNGCVVPFKISSPVAQDVTLSLFELVYDSSIGPASSNKFYDVAVEDVKITTNKSLSFDLSDLKIKVPTSGEGTKNETFRLKFNEQELFNKAISITSSFDFNVTPKFALIGIETEFSASLGNVTSEWDFGDESNLVVSQNNKARHAYSGSGNYDLSVTLTKADGKSSTKIFDVTVGNAEESAASIIDKYEKRLANLTSKINSLNSLVKSNIESQINVTEMNASLALLKSEYNSASTDSDFEAVVNGLLELNVPQTIAISKTGTLPIAAGFNNMNTDLAKQISGANASQADDALLRGNIAAWNSKNYDADAEFEVTSIYYDSETKDVATKYKMTISKKADSTDTNQAYLFINYPKESIEFAGGYSAESAGVSGTYIPISDVEVIEFVLPEYVSIETLGAYISPKISVFGTVYSGNISEFISRFPWIKFLIWITILIIITLVIYITLQEWYKRKYELYLFKEPHQAFNLVNFIYNARVSGVKDDSIKEKLKKAGWKGEQITYAFKKIDGKRTGMWEIPIFKFFENRTVKKEIEKRHSGEVDLRFVKKPSF